MHTTWDSYYPFYLTGGGRSDEAVDVARRAFERDPLSASWIHTLAVQFAFAGRRDEAIEEPSSEVYAGLSHLIRRRSLASTFAAAQNHKLGGSR